MTVLTATQVLEYALGAGFTRAEADVMTAIAHYESGYNTKAHGDLTLAKNGSLGLWQVFSGAHSLSELKIKAYTDLYDPATNARAARIVYKEQGYTAWSTYNHYHSTAAWTALVAKVAAIHVGTNPGGPAPMPAPAPSPGPTPVIVAPSGSKVNPKDKYRLAGNKNARAIEALVRCAAEHAHGAAVWHNLCLAFCNTELGTPHLGGTALEAWTRAGRAHQHGWYNPPAGVPVFWGGGSGHVAIADGHGNVWSTDIRRSGLVDLVPIGEIHSKWGKPYLGWADVLNTVRVFN